MTPDAYGSSAAREALLQHHSSIPADQLIWTGRPPQRPLFRFIHIFKLSYLLIVGLSFLWVGWRLFDVEENWIFVLAMAVGFIGYFCVYRATLYYVLRAWKYRSCSYGLTPEHLLVLQGKNLMTYTLSVMRDLKYEYGVSPYGTLTFKYAEIVFHHGPEYDWESKSLQDVPQVEDVYQKIIQLQPSALEATHAHPPAAHTF